MFTEEALSQIASAVINRIPIVESSERWPELMTLKTAAKYTDCSVNSLRQLMKEDRIYNASFDSKVRFRKSDLDKLIANL